LQAAKIFLKEGFGKVSRWFRAGRKTRSRPYHPKWFKISKPQPIFECHSPNC